MLTDDPADPVARSNSWKEMGSVPRDRVSIEDDAVASFETISIAALTDGKAAPRPAPSFQKFCERATARATAPDSGSQPGQLPPLPLGLGELARHYPDGNPERVPIPSR